MDEIYKSDFDLPWCRDLITDPSVKPVNTFSRVANGDGGENSLLALSLKTSKTIRACRFFIRSPSDFQTLDTSAHMLFSLGPNVNSIAGVCHGSIISLMFDETFGQLMTHSFDRESLITAELRVSFKRPLVTPAVVLCTASIEGIPEGRKTWMRGEITDGGSTVFAQATCLYLTRKAKGHL
ncbi:MAG: hypothetical protein Q9168_006621 [Polycauliona sp. 1 TL-2023]